MPFELPNTPQSPSQATFNDFASKATGSPIQHSLPTPAHSVNGSMSSLSAVDFQSQGEEITNKRKRDVDDQGDQEQKKVHVEDSRISIDDLHMDVGAKSLLCRTPHYRAGPDIKFDLFKMYGLGELAGSVARYIPGPNGPKKNGIRKTYKGYIKKLQITGNFDVDKKEFGDEETLYTMVTKPQEIWEQEIGVGMDIEHGLSEKVLASLSKATMLLRGPIKKDLWNPSVLGELNTASTPATVGTPSTKQSAPNPTASRPSKSEGGGRAKRTGNKRRYNETSFEGYGEGFVDDEADGNYSAGEEDDDDRGGARKKAKKSGSSISGSSRTISYGPGMIGA